MNGGQFLPIAPLIDSGQAGRKKKKKIIHVRGQSKFFFFSF